jgi:hypothetical protein
LGSDVKPAFGGFGREEGLFHEKSGGESVRPVPGSVAGHYKLILKHNRDDSDANGGNNVAGKSREVAMNNVSRYRAMSSLCRQHAAYNPSKSWQLLADAERWEHLAAMEMSSGVEQSKSAGSGDLAKVGARLTANDVAA